MKHTRGANMSFYIFSTRLAKYSQRQTYLYIKGKQVFSNINKLLYNLLLGVNPSLDWKFWPSVSTCYSLNIFPFNQTINILCY